MLEDFRSHRGIAPLTTGFDYPVFLETISLLQFRHPKARGVQSTKSVGQALRVSLVKPGAYLSASERSANLEAISHFTTGIELLKTLPETPEHTQHALTLHSALGAALQMAKGIAAPEVEQRLHPGIRVVSAGG